MDLIGRTIHNQYKVIRKIRDGGMSTVWLGIDLKNDLNVAVKVLKKGVTSDKIEDIIRFRNEANIVSKLNISGTVKVYEVDELDGLQYIVMEYLKGSSLQDLIMSGRRFTVEEATDIIYKICEVLKSVHDAGVIFRDLKPGNIIINKEDTMEIKLIDFGLSQMREYNYMEENQILGTLHYMSPEQSGVLRRNVDERTDLYSLGVIFYQLLTLRLPFDGYTINTIIHQHAVRIPNNPKDYNPAVPNIVERIIFKLLSKEPEERYQSAEGLMKDLDKIKKGQLNFSISANEKLTNLNYRTNLVGRDKEYDTLKHMYDKASTGKGGICFISGEAGSGKTKLAEELKNHVAKTDGVFIDGKCFSGENKMPYSVFKEAVNSYLKIYQSFSTEKKTEIRIRIKSKVGDLGKIILKLNPLAEELLGSCPEPVELLPDSENKRFTLVVSKFIYALANENEPLVILLDDLQWVDEGSISILNELTYNIADTPLLIVGTYRNNEVEEEHAIVKFNQVFMANDYPIVNINLAPFTLEGMYHLVSKLLFDQGIIIREISEFVLRRSGGNPFFAVEILKQMIFEKAIQRNENQWQLSHDILDRLQIPTSIVDILLKRISGLSEEEKYVLSYAALIGRKFSISFLFQLINLNGEIILEVVDKALTMQFLEQSRYEKGELYFVHDRIQEAFSIIVEANDKKKAHLLIANLLETTYRNDIDKNIFGLTQHYYEGGEMNKALKYAHSSGLKAKSSYAYESAYQYFLLEKKILDLYIYTEDRIACIIQLAEVSTYIGKNEEAIALLEAILPEMNSITEKTDAYLLICNAYYYMGDCVMSYEFGRRGLSLLGEILPRSKFFELLAIVKECIIRLIYMSMHKSIYTNKVMKENSEKYKRIHLYYRTLNNMTAYFSIIKFIYGLLRGLNIVERKIGWSIDLGYGIGGMGGFLAAIGKFDASIRYFSKAVDIFHELNELVGLANEYQFMAFSNEFKGDYEKAVEIIDKSINIFTGLGEVKGTCVSINVLIHQYYFTGNYEKMYSLIEEYLSYQNKTKDISIKNSANVYKMQYYRETGELDKSLEFGNCITDPSFDKKDSFNYCVMCIELGITNIELGNTKEALYFLHKAKEINERDSFFKQYTVHLYPYLAEAYMMEYHEAQVNNSEIQKRKLLGKIKKACTAALKQTERYPTHYGISLRVMAKYHQLTGAIEKAEALYQKSIDHSNTYHRKYEMGKSLYAYGMLQFSLMRQKAAFETIQSAFQIFGQLNAKAYVWRCKRYLGLSNNDIANNTDKLSQSIRASQQMSSITSLAQQISSILDLEMLLGQIMQAALEISGAQNGFLFIKDQKSGEMKLAISKMSAEDKTYDSSYISKSIFTSVLQSGEPIISTNAMEDEIYSGFNSIVIKEIKSVLCFPIKYNNALKAVCYLDNKSTSSVFTEEDISLLSVFFTQAAISIENAELYKMATTDGLTGLISHRHFRTLLDKELQRSKRYNRHFSLIIFDVDGFKKINDTNGHQAGDEVLMKISDLIRQNLRNLDIVARYGGDEFAIILPETDTESAFQCAEKVRKAINDMDIFYENSKFHITLSLGIAQYPKHADNETMLIKLADAALYRSKRSGGNKTTVYSE